MADWFMLSRVLCFTIVHYDYMDSKSRWKHMGFVEVMGLTFHLELHAIKVCCLASWRVGRLTVRHLRVNKLLTCLLSSFEGLQLIQSVCRVGVVVLWMTVIVCLMTAEESYMNHTLWVPHMKRGKLPHVRLHSAPPQVLKSNRLVHLKDKGLS